MFCAYHPIPHEDCPHCHSTVAVMRPTVFAELAAAELRSGTECCERCEYVFYEAVMHCPRCGEPSPFHAEAAHDDVSALPTRDMVRRPLRNGPGGL